MVHEHVQKLQTINLFKHGKGLRLLDVNLGFTEGITGPHYPIDSL